jgi:molybdate transport system substrate-binding protein
MLLASLLLLAHRSFRAGDDITIFAAASLKEAFTTIGASYEKEHPGTNIKFNFAGSQLLAQQINAGAPAEVFASADQRNLEKIQYDAKSRRVFARNHLTIVVRTGMSGILAPSNLSKAQRFVVADPSVPVGSYTEMFFAKAAKRFGPSWLSTVRSEIVSKELDVKSVLTKVQLGEADAGIVYVSDAVAAGASVVRVDIPDELNVTADYPVAIPADAVNRAGAKDFVGFLFTPASQRVLQADGFLPAVPASTKDHRRATSGAHVRFPVLISQVFLASTRGCQEIA